MATLSCKNYHKRNIQLALDFTVKLSLNETAIEYLCDTKLKGHYMCSYNIDD